MQCSASRDVAVLVSTEVCGNNIVASGEQCDSGTDEVPADTRQLRCRLHAPALR
jgi:hypothetical protein